MAAFNLGRSLAGFGCIVAATLVPASATSQQAPAAPIDRSKLVSVKTVESWIALRDTYGPTFTAGPGWLKLVAFVKKELAAQGVTDIVSYKFPYTRWYTTEYPDRSGWSFTSAGRKVNVASYGFGTGSTGPKGVTAPMILYDLTVPVAQRPKLADLKGKIVVIRQQPYATLQSRQRVKLDVPAPATPPAHCGNPPLCTDVKANEVYPSWALATTAGHPALASNDIYRDYEYTSTPEDFPGGVGGTPPLSVETSFRNRDQFGQVIPVIWNVLAPSGAVGAVTVMDLSPLAALGSRIHDTPMQSNVPVLILDRVAGAQVIADARSGKNAKLVLDAKQEENAPAEQFVAILPGRDYGTARDKAILVATHLDGPGIVQDNGPYAILSIFHYFTQIPRSQRAKTLVAYFDSRHFVPGREGAYPFSMIADRPELFRNVVGGLLVEHWGGRQFGERGEEYYPTGKAATTYVFGWPNPTAIDVATQAIKDNAVPRAINDVPLRPGVHGLPQYTWKGSSFATHLVRLGEKVGGWPGWHISGDWPSSGFQAYYPAAKTRFDPSLFARQSGLAVELVSTLMTGDVIALAPGWGYLQLGIGGLAEGDFSDAARAADARSSLSGRYDSVFAAVKAGDYPRARHGLDALQSESRRALTEAAAAKLDTTIGQCRLLADTAIGWKAGTPAG